MRACELRAIEIQDHVFLREGIAEPDYAARRAAAFFIAVNCAHAGGTCFCVSMEAGPRAERGFDLALTELIDKTRHDFLIEIGSERGQNIAAQLPLRPGTANDRKEADAIVANTASSMGRQMQTDGIKDLLQNNPDHPQWDDVAARCLSCANCTFVCPTCFCHSEEDVTDLDGLRAERHQRWDSCFTMDFTHLPGGAVRGDVHTRYRHWMTHKLASWHDQFGESGCVGCGRCITWCPAGIDITAEVAKIRTAGKAG
jgi:formate hydrogenlyase subunit 6/NADH:ubiquinone oxidoreductase subunit I